MSKGIKSFVIIFIIVLLVLGITWAVYENYKAVAFNMDKLYEYDPDGVTAFMLRQFRL